MSNEFNIDFARWDELRNTILGDLLPDPTLILEIISGGVRELQIRGVQISFADSVSDDEAYTLWSVFSVFPPAILSYIFKDKSIVILPHEDFLHLQDEFLSNASPSMGANFTQHNFVIDNNLLHIEKRKEKLHIAIWYVISSIMAQQLSDITGFDSLRFQAQFVRYLREKTGETAEVDTQMREFFDALFEAEFVNQNIIRSIYAEKMRVELPNYRRIMNTHLPMTWNMPSVFQPNFLNQIQEQGFTLDLGRSIALSLGMVNARQRDRPESSHELRLLFYSRWINNLLSSYLKVGDWQPAAMLSAGMSMSYQTQKPESSKVGRIFLGSGFDIGLEPQSGIILHSFLGVPIFVSSKGLNKQSWLPCWEVGIVSLRLSGSLFIGLSASSSFYDLTSQYYGLVLRYEGF